MTQANYSLENPNAAGEAARLKARLVTQPVTAGLRGIKAAQDMHDQGLAQRLDAERKSFENQLKIKIEENPYFLIDEAGNPREGVIAKEKSDYIARMKKANSGNFWNPEYQQRANLMQDEYLSTFDDSLRLMQVRAVNQWGKDNFKNNLALAEYRGDYIGANDAVDGAEQAKIIDRTEADLMRAQITDKQLTNDAQIAWNSSPEDLAKLWDAGHFDKASQDVQRDVENMLKRAGGMKIDQPTTRRVKNNDGTETVEKVAPEAPRGLPSYLVQVWNEQGGSFKTPDARDAAMPLLASWARSQITSPNNPQEVERVKTVMKAYGASDGYASAIVDMYQKDLGAGREFDPSDSWDITEQNDFLPTDINDKIDAWQQRLYSISLLPKDEQDEEEIEMLEANIQTWDDNSESRLIAAKSVINGKFEMWRQANPNADYRAQFEAFWEIKDSYLEKTRRESVEHRDMAAYKAGTQIADHYDTIAEKSAIEAELEAESNAEDVKETEAARDLMRQQKNNNQQPSVISMNLSTSGNSTLSLEGNADESILYVPKGSGIAQGDILVRADGDIASYARVIETDKVTSPTMSLRLRGNMGDYTGENKSITISGKEARLSTIRGKGSSSNYVTGGFAGELDSSRLPEPLRPYADDFIELGDKYGVNPALLAAISMHETAKGTSNAFRNKNNAMGISDARGVLPQSSVRGSIERMARLLGRARMYKGKELAEIAKVYAPVGAGNDPRGLNHHWTKGVQNYINLLTQ